MMITLTEEKFEEFRKEFMKIQDKHFPKMVPLDLLVGSIKGFCHQFKKYELEPLPGEDRWSLIERIEKDFKLLFKYYLDEEESGK